jgi:hypothetical protein
MSPPEEARDRPSLEVPLATVPARGSRRALVATLAIGAVLVGSFGLATLTGQHPTSRPSPPAVAIDPSSPPSTASEEPDQSPVAEQLPEIQSVSLDGAPGMSFLRRDGDDLLLFGWHPDGHGLVRTGRMPGAYSGMPRAADPISLVSPDARFVVLVIPDEGQQIIRVVSRAGVAWERRGVGASGYAVWAEDSGQVVVPLDAGPWLVLDVARIKPELHRIEMDAVGPPGPLEGPDSRPQPLAFSADGRWVYGMAGEKADPHNRTLFRAPAKGGRPTRMREWPTRGPERAISDEFDPATGRTVDPTGFPNGNTSTLTVRNPDGSKAWETTFAAIVGTVWIGDGRLAVMDADRIDTPQYLAVVPVSAEGNVMRSLVDGGPLSGGGFSGARKGYIIAGFFQEFPDRRLLLAVIDPDDGRAGTLTLPGDELDQLRFGGRLD